MLLLDSHRGKTMIVVFEIIFVLMSYLSFYFILTPEHVPIKT